MCCAGPSCLLSTLFLALPGGSAAPADRERAVAYVGARMLTATGAPIEKGVLLAENGKIRGIGPAASITVPDGATVIDLRGKTIIPGLVDTHSHVGVWSRPPVAAHQDGNEGSGPVQSSLRALDAVFPDDPGIRMAV